MSTPPPQSPPSPAASPPVSISAWPICAKNPKPIPWTHEETVQLIRAYQEKWYQLRRGQLKSGQWEEVAVTVAARCGYDHAELSKSATQCRHKMEKLRQRHRAVKKRLGRRTTSGWPFFELMEILEHGPMPISARPMATMPCQQQRQPRRRELEVDHRYGGGNDEEDDEENGSKVRSIDYILQKPTFVNRFSGGKGSFSQESAATAAKMAVEHGGYSSKAVVPPQQPGNMMVAELAEEIRGFAERLIGVENTRMEMMKETERWRLEMEERRNEMILESQQKIMDSIDKAFGGSF